VIEEWIDDLFYIHYLVHFHAVIVLASRICRRNNANGFGPEIVSQNYDAYSREERKICAKLKIHDGNSDHLIFAKHEHINVRAQLLKF
jgi:hypothetical protein